MVARNVGRSVVAVSCDQSLKSEVSPTPMTVRFSQRGRRRAALLDMFYSFRGATLRAAIGSIMPVRAGDARGSPERHNGEPTRACTHHMASGIVMNRDGAYAADHYHSPGNIMRFIIGLAVCFCALQASQALADDQTSDQPAATSPPASSAAAPTSSSSSAQPASAAKPAAATTATASDEDTDKRLRSQGYKPETHNGAKVYCRKETELGSRFPSKVCATPEQIANANKDSQDALDKVQRQSPATRSN
jgi:hypothetical protein